MQPMIQRRSLLTAVLLPLIIGGGGLVRLMNEPRFAQIRTVDVVQLTGSGACFGVAMLALVMYFRLPRA
jgi:hypothetical protein